MRCEGIAFMAFRVRVPGSDGDGRLAIRRVAFFGDLLRRTSIRVASVHTQLPFFEVKAYREEKAKGNKKEFTEWYLIHTSHSHPIKRLPCRLA